MTGDPNRNGGSGGGATRPAAARALATGPMAGILWAGLAVAFSPVLLDLARHHAEQSWARYSLLFPVLFAVCVRRQGPAAPARGAGAALVAGALAVLLFAVGGGVVRLARPALVLAAIGLCRATGLASLRTAALIAWAIPVPHALVDAVDTWSGGGLPALAVRAAAPLGVLLEQAPAVARAGTATLPLEPWYGGVPLAGLLSGLAWYDGVRRELPWRATARSLAAWSLLAAPLQLAALLLAFALLAGGRPTTAAFLLDDALWGATAIGVLLRFHRSALRSGPA